MRHSLCVEDDPITTKLVMYLLQGEGYETTHVPSAVEARAALRRQVYDLILLDVMLPDMNGLPLCQELRGTLATPIILMSMRCTVEDVVAGLQVGADDYVRKPFDPNELLARIRAVLRRKSELVAHASRLETDELVLDVVNNKVTLVRINKTIGLTPTETRLLLCLLSHPGRAISRQTLMMYVWGYPYQDGSNQVEICIKRLRAKIEEDPGAPQYLVTVRGVGYQFQPSSVSDPAPAQMLAVDR